MPIVYQPDEHILHLAGPTFSYCLKIDGERLVNLYWGPRLSEAPLSYLLDSYWAGASFDLQTSRLPLELPTRGGGCYALPAVGAVNRDGNDLVQLAYEGHEIRRGKPALSGLPACYVEAEEEATTLEVTLRDRYTGLVVVACYTVFEQLDALTRSLRLKNEGQQALTLTHAMSASVPLYGGDYQLIHLAGAWARERSPIRQPLCPGSARIESLRGASGHEHNPFAALVKPDTTKFTGPAWAMNLIYSGSFLAECQVNNFHDTRLSMGLHPDAFRWQLAPGECFQSPEAVLCYSGEGLNGLSQRLHRLYRTRLCRGRWRDRPRPILINNWEATYFDFTEDKILEIARRAKEIGVELFVLDDGWFGKRDSDNCSLGDWVANRRKLPEGIEGIARKVNALGLTFGLWFEPEMVSPDSELYRAHPDWCLHAPGRPRTQARQQLILDLSRREVQDYLIDSVSRVLASAPIGYVKWDMNRNMSEPFCGTARPERQMETQHRYMLGLYRVLEEITSRFPEVLFESCSGGGGRFDGGMLYYMPQTWTSDDTDPVERLKIQYGTSLAYPASAMGAHVSASPNHQTGRRTGMRMRGEVALSGNFGFELDLSQLDGEDLAAARRLVEQVKALRETVQQGAFTRLESPFEGNHCAWQFLSPEGGRLVLCHFQRLSEPNPTPHRVYPQALQPDAWYREEESGRIYLGGALMHAGLPVPPAREDFTSQVFEFTRLN